MSKTLWSGLSISAIALVASTTAVMAEGVQDTNKPAATNTNLLRQLNRYSQEGNSRSLGQVNSVDQLRDVSSSHWAYGALKNLIDKYGCMRGFPDRTFRGNEGVNRYQFAATLSECLQKIEEFIDRTTNEAGTPDSTIRSGLTPGDMRQIQRLVSEFDAELAILSARVDDIEGRVDTLEDQQFSTTTKLEGEVVFALSDAQGNGSSGSNTVLEDRVRLAFVSSFTGKDALYTRLDAGAFGGFGNTDQGDFTHSFGNGNNIEIGWLAYYLPIGDKILVYVPTAFPLWQDIAPTVSPYLDGFTGANNALTGFGESSPIYKIGLGAGGGVGVNYELTEKISLTTGYFGYNASDPSNENGLFNGSYSALGQLTWTPDDKFKIAATYVNAYFNDLEGDDTSIFSYGPGTDIGNAPFNALGEVDGNPIGTKVITNSYGVQASYKLSEKVAINGFFGYTDADEVIGSKSSAEIWYYGLGIAFPDLGKEGNLGGIVLGAEPYVGGCEGANCAATAQDTALHVEGFYRYAINDNISVTPGIVWIGAPDGNSDENVVLGTIRTTFTF